MRNAGGTSGSSASREAAWAPSPAASGSQWDLGSAWEGFLGKELAHSPLASPPTPDTLGWHSPAGGCEWPRKLLYDTNLILSGGAERTNWGGAEGHNSRNTAPRTRGRASNCSAVTYSLVLDFVTILSWLWCRKEVGSTNEASLWCLSPRSEILGHEQASCPTQSRSASWPITMEQTLKDSSPGYLKKKGNGDSRVFFLVNFHFNQETTRKQNSEALFPSVLY